MRERIHEIFSKILIANCAKIACAKVHDWNLILALTTKVRPLKINLYARTCSECGLVSAIANDMSTEDCHKLFGTQS